MTVRAAFQCASAVDRAGRVGTIESIETQTTSAAAVDRGVLN